MTVTDPLPPQCGSTSYRQIVKPATTDSIHDLLNANPADQPLLTQEVYPRIFPTRAVTSGYYAAMGLWYLSASVVPLAGAYLAWFCLAYEGQRHFGLALTASAYAVCEVVFAVYMGHIIRQVQKPSLSSVSSSNRRQELLRKIINVDVAADPRGDTEACTLGRLGEVFSRHARQDGAEAMTAVQERPSPKRKAQQKDLLSDKKLKRDIEVQVDEGLSASANTTEQLHHSHPHAVEFRERLRTWFHHAAWTSIRRDNVLEWLAWSCFKIQYDHCKADLDRVAALEDIMDMLEARTGTVFEQGYNSEIRSMRLTLDPVNAKARPFMIYAVINAVNWYLLPFAYASYGMTFHKEGEISYLVRVPPGWTPARARSDARLMPIVYLHGLGFGLLQYYPLIKGLITKLNSHPILIPIAPYTAQSVFHPRHLRPWTQDEVVRGMTAICKRWGFWDGDKSGGVSMMSHSNGSIAHAWMLKRCPAMISRNTFIDPVCFCLWEGDICHSFCYREPKTALEVLLFYFVACEVGIANYIQRYFDWADNSLFADEIPALTDSSRTAFFLGGQDIILDAARTRRYLERRQLTTRPMY